MKTLVTGATGFIGSHVVDILRDADTEIVCIARPSSDLRWLEGKNVRIINASLDNSESLIPAVKDIDMIIHVAGLTAARNDAEFLRGNRDATQNLLEMATIHAPNLQRFLHVSSQTVTGPSRSLDEPVHEKSPLQPITAYGRSKKAAEEVVQSFSDRLPITIVRPPAVYGERDTAILTFFQSVSKGIVPLIGFDEKRVSLIHGFDLARGIVEAAYHQNTIGETYFVSSEEFYSWKQIANITKEAFGKSFILPVRVPHGLVMTLAGLSEIFGRFSTKPPVLNFEKGKDLIQPYWICSVEKAQKDFDWKQQISIEQGIERTVRWYIDNKWV
ncbi:MAG: NAD-dependent epimerase/dehydratase family protein [Candidatus Kapaibacteriota bacterium]